MDQNGFEDRIEHRVGSRFEAVLPEGSAVLGYTESGGRMVIVHTDVPPEFRGRGLAGRLVRAALDHARAQGWVVEPRCSYAADWIRRHPDYADLLAPGAGTV